MRADAPYFKFDPADIITDKFQGGAYLVLSLRGANIDTANYMVLVLQESNHGVYKKGETEYLSAESVNYYYEQLG